MRRFRGLFAALLLFGMTGIAGATYHSYEITEVYSNADGTIQFVLLHEYAGLNGQDLLAGHTLTATHGAYKKTFVFPYDLPSTSTSGRYILIATQGYADAAASISAFVRPDYVIPNRFLPTDRGIVNYADVDEISYEALPSDGDLALYTPPSSPSYLATNVVRNFGGAFSTLPVLAVTAVEYYSPALDHYFISNLAPDIDALDLGRIAGWYRTGYTFYVYPRAGDFLRSVCRYYIPPQHGNSHFFSASQSECAAIANRIGFDPNYSGYILETSTAFYIDLPDTRTGACPGGTIPVYRLWNARVDSNHRYTTDLSVKAYMLSLGYVAEGYGPGAVAMCSPF